MLRKYVAVAVAIVRTCPRAIPLAMITMRKSIHGFPLISIYGMLMGSAWWPFGPSELRFKCGRDSKEISLIKAACAMLHSS